MVCASSQTYDNDFDGIAFKVSAAQPFNDVFYCVVAQTDGETL